MKGITLYLLECCVRYIHWQLPVLSRVKASVAEAEAEHAKGKGADSLTEIMRTFPLTRTFTYKHPFINYGPKYGSSANAGTT
jgi:hypothetical protein